MNETILMSRLGAITPLPRKTWEQHLAHVPEHSATRLGFMSPAHHQVRTFVVRELPLRGEPIEPQVIAQALQLPLTRVERILEELERKLFFLVRNAQGAVAWAYPVTVEKTPHQLTFSGGERLFAA